MLNLALFVTTTAATYFYNESQRRRAAFYREKIKNLYRAETRPPRRVRVDWPRHADEGRPKERKLKNECTTIIC